MKPTSPKTAILLGLGLLAPMLAAKASRRLAGKTYQLVTDRDVPDNPGNSNTGWREALVWGAASGMVGGLARLGAKRMLSETPLLTGDEDMDKAID